MITREEIARYWELEKSIGEGTDLKADIPEQMTIVEKHLNELMCMAVRFLDAEEVKRVPGVCIEEQLKDYNSILAKIVVHLEERFNRHSGRSGLQQGKDIEGDD